MITGTLLAFFHPETTAKTSQRMLTFAERVNYQRAIEEVYWRHRIWPSAKAKPALDAVTPQARLEKKVADYLRKSQALEDYWQRPITSDQLQAEMDRMAAGTKQPEVLRELFEALGNDPFVIAECFARQALADRLLRNWYASDQRIHGELKKRADADLQTCRTVEQMKRTSGTYSEVEFVRSESPREEAVPCAGHGVKLNSDEWDNTVQKLGSLFPAVAAGIPPEPEHGKKEPDSRGLTAAQIKTGILSALQEDETRYYATAVMDKTDKGLRLATVSWVKDPLRSWLSRMENQLPSISTTMDKAYSLPEISDGAGCIDDTWTPTVGPPDARYAHTAIWTGSEMIVWGGLNGVAFNTGYKYDPTTDNWTPTSTVGAPSGRGYHTAVWTGSDMIVWGGSPDGSSDVNTGGRYNPNNDSWTATSTTNVPTGRYDHTAVWNGSEMIVWGGWHGGNVNTGGIYNPTTDSWASTSTTNAPTARNSHTAVWSGNKMIVWGGYASVSEVNTGGRYDPGSDSWTPTNTVNAPEARDYHTAVWTGSEMIIWGGHSNEFGEFNTGGRYNPNTDSWTATTTVNAPSARNSHTAIWTGSEMIIWGAATDTSGGRYNPATDSWTSTSTTNAPAFRFYHTDVWTGSEMIVWGGEGHGPWTLNTGGRYNPTTDSWVPTNTYNVPTARHAHAAVWTGTEMIVWGGMTSGSPSTHWNNGATYNAITDNWAAISTINAPVYRQSYTTVWTGTEMIIWGGSSLNTGGRYNPNTDSWITTSTVNAPTDRSAHTAVWTGSEMIIWGGDDSSGFANTGGRYNPNTDSWTATSISSAPTGRDSHSAVWAGTEMIIWGGYFFDFMGHNLTTGGRYNPTTDAWLTTSTTNTPDGRSSHTAVWTGTEMVVWGGISFDPFHNPQYLNTGGRYNPSTDSWTATSMSNVPTSRRSYTSVWTGDEMIIWGGSSLNDGGRYSPTSDAWRTTNTTTAPVGRESHTAVWTGTEMIIWGGERDPGGDLNVGARYCAVFTTPSPTSTATPTPTATATATTTPTPTSTVTPRVSPTPRTRPSPRGRPTPPSHITPVPPPSSPHPTPVSRP